MDQKAGGRGRYLRRPPRHQLLLLAVGFCLFLVGLLLPLWHVHGHGPGFLRTIGVIFTVLAVIVRFWEPKH